MRTLQHLISGLAFALHLLVSAQAAEPSPSPPETSTAQGDLVCDDAGRAISRIQARYDDLTDLRADFEQTTNSVVLGSGPLAGGETSRGTVVLAKPGKMRWSYREPAPSFVISDGRTLWVYDVESAQASKVRVRGGYLAGAALEFLLGEGRLVESFHVSMGKCGPEGIELDLLPRAPASYERLALTAQIGTGLITATSLVDLFGNRTTIRFSEIRLDESPDPDGFTFVPPEGVAVTDLEASR